jgi:hypothetical protein
VLATRALLGDPLQLSYGVRRACSSTSRSIPAHDVDEPAAMFSSFRRVSWVRARHLCFALGSSSLPQSETMPKSVALTERASGQLDRDVATPLPPRVRRTRPAKLARYSAIIGTRLASYPELSAVRLFEECRAAGYAGGLSQLQIYVRQSFPPQLIPGPWSPGITSRPGAQRPTSAPRAAPAPAAPAPRTAPDNPAAATGCRARRPGGHRSDRCARDNSRWCC